MRASRTNWLPLALSWPWACGYMLRNNTITSIGMRHRSTHTLIFTTKPTSIAMGQTIRPANHIPIATHMSL